MNRFRNILATLAVAACMPVYAGGADDGKKYDYFFLEAMCERQKGNNDAAFDLLSRCLELKPGAAEVYFYLAQYYEAMKSKEKSMECVEKAARLDPDNMIFQEALVQKYIDGAKFAEAIQAVEGIVAKEPGRTDMLAMLGQLYQQQGDFDNTLKTLERLEQADGKSESLAMAKSEIYTRKGDKAAAIAEIEKLADQYPNDLNYRSLYGDILMANGQEKKAVEIFRKILREEPDNNKALMSMRIHHKIQKDTAAADSVTMRILLNKNSDTETRVYILRQEIKESEDAGGDSTKILGYFRKMLEQPQADADIAYLCAVYMQLKKMPEADVERTLRQVLAIAPDNAAARLQLVAYAWRADSLDRVIDLCRAARQYNPEEMAFYYYQGMAYNMKGNTGEALSALRNGISAINEESDTETVSDFYGLMGDLLFHSGDKEAGFAAYDSCLQWKPDNIGCLNNYAYYLSVENTQLDKAEKMSYRTIKAEPDNATYLDTYAWILYRQQRYAEAKVYIDQALKNDSDGSSVVLEHAGDIYMKTEAYTQAAEAYAKAAAIDPANADLKKKAAAAERRRKQIQKEKQK